MSCLVVPRIHYCGMLAANTPTANNNNYDLVLDQENVRLFPPYDTMDDASFRKLMMALVWKELPYNLGLQDVLNANWNFYGQNSITPSDVKVSTAEDLNGHLVDTSAQDPVIQLPLTFQGDNWGDSPTPAIIVDNDPVSNLTSQLFVTKIQLGGPTLGFTAAANGNVRLPRMYSRWIYLTRNLLATPDACFSAYWQQAIPNELLQFRGLDRSPILQQLADAANASAGLVMRFCTYYFQRKYTDPELAAMFAAGQFVQNESKGFILGTIGSWDKGSLGSVPYGRQMLPNPNLLSINTSNGPRTFSLGPVSAALDLKRSVMTLDLVNCFPEVNLASPTAPDPTQLQKVDLGVASLQVNTAVGAAILGTFPYDTQTYLKRAGLVEIPLTPDQIALCSQGSLSMTCSAASANPVLLEQDLVAETDDRAVYITNGEKAAITVQVRQRGEIPPAGTPIGIEQYRMQQVMGPNKNGYPTVPNKYNTPVGSTPGAALPNALPFVHIDPVKGVTDSNGLILFNLTAIQPATGKLLLKPSASVAPPPDPASEATWVCLFWSNVRVLPDDSDLDAIPDEQLTWDLVYDKTLRYFYRLYPTMDPQMTLNNEAACAARAPMIKLLTDKENWFSTLYMPITRELSDGKRRLLHRWCAKVIAGGSNAKTPPARGV